MAQLKTRRRWRPTREQVSGTRESVFLATGLRADLGRLDSDEVAELAQLVREIEGTADEGVQRSDPAALDDVNKLRRYELLASKAGGKPKDFFDRERERAAAVAAATERARQPKSHQTPWEEGTIVLPPSMWRGLAEGGLPAVHLLILTVVVGAIQNRAPIHSYMRVEDEAVVVSSVEYLLAPLDEGGDVRHVAQAIRELADVDLLRVEKRGDVRISLGPMLADELKGMER